MDNDLTILYITASEMPARWVKFAVGHLLKAAGNAPIISISRKSMDLGVNLIDSEPKSFWNIYMQMLRGAKLATTPYVAIAEDDTLYTKAHFWEHRPKLDHVAYDHSRWSLFTWDNVYCVRQRLSNCSLIAPREYLIDALEERKAKWPNGAPNEIVGEVGREKVDRRLGVSIRNCDVWYSYGPIVQLNHPTGSEPSQKKKWKRHGQIRAYNIPHWGEAKNIINEYIGG